MRGASEISKFFYIPGTPFLYYWGRLIVLCCVANHILITFMAAFHVHSLSGILFGYGLDILFLVDMFIKSHTAFLQDGFWVIFPREMRRKYFRSLEFKFDVLSNFPFEIFALVYLSKSETELAQMVGLFRLTRLLRTVKCVIFFHKETAKLSAGIGIELFKFFVYYGLMLHSLACTWFAMACPAGNGLCYQYSWVGLVSSDGSPTSPDPLPESYKPEDAYTVIRNLTLPLETMYLISFYWTATTLSTTGYGDLRAQNDVERIFAALTMTLGIIYFGFISGTIASVLANMDARRVAYKERLDTMNKFLKSLKVDRHMQNRVLEYYYNIWERNRGIQVDTLFDDMPLSLHTEVASCLNYHAIDKVEIFKSCSEGFRRRLAFCMKLYLFTSNEYITHKDDVGLEMYLIRQGRVDVLPSDDATYTITTLVGGDYFGEMGVILGQHHDSSAICKCNSDVYALSRQDILEAFIDYPEDKEIVLEATREQYFKTGGLPVRASTADTADAGRNSKSDKDVLLAHTVPMNGDNSPPRSQVGSMHGPMNPNSSASSSGHSLHLSAEGREDASKGSLSHHPDTNPSSPNISFRSSFLHPSNADGNGRSILNLRRSGDDIHQNALRAQLNQHHHQVHHIHNPLEHLKHHHHSHASHAGPSWHHKEEERIEITKNISIGGYLVATLPSQSASLKSSLSDRPKSVSKPGLLRSIDLQDHLSTSQPASGFRESFLRDHPENQSMEMKPYSHEASLSSVSQASVSTPPHLISQPSVSTPTHPHVPSIQAMDDAHTRDTPRLSKGPSALERMINHQSGQSSLPDDFIPIKGLAVIHPLSRSTDSIPEETEHKGKKRKALSHVELNQIPLDYTLPARPFSPNNYVKLSASHQGLSGSKSAQNLPSELYSDTPAPAPKAGPIFQETPARKSSPIFTDTPARKSSPIFTDTPARKSSPIFIDTPARKSSPIFQETPSRKSSPIFQETPSRKGSPIFTDTPSRKGSPIQPIPNQGQESKENVSIFISAPEPNYQQESREAFNK